MKNKVSEYIDKYGMLPDGARVLVALSGGQDSMCLMDVLRKLAPEKHLTVCAAHVEHGIRKDDSIADMEFVREYCARNGIELFVKRVDIPMLAAETGKSTEQTAREQRYAFFDEVCAGGNIDVVATAHHGNDQAESVILNLLRGGAIDGLAGMAPVNGKYIKPFLCVTKNEIEQYCTEQNISYVTDATNSDVKYTRNFVRHVINPMLARVNADFAETIMRNSEYVRDEKNYLERIAEAVYGEIATERDGEVMLDAQRLAEQDGVIRVRLYKRASRATGVLQDLYAVHYTMLEDMLLSGRKGAELDLPGGLKATLGHGGLLFSTKESEYLQPVTVSGAGVYRLGKAEIVIEAIDTVPKSFGAGVEYVDRAKWPMEAVLRTRLSGDTFRPINGGCKKLKKLFIDKKIDVSSRDAKPIIAVGNEVLYIEGIGISESVKVTEQTEQVYAVKCIYNGYS